MRASKVGTRDLPRVSWPADRQRRRICRASGRIGHRSRRPNDENGVYWTLTLWKKLPTRNACREDTATLAGRPHVSSIRAGDGQKRNPVSAPPDARCRCFTRGGSSLGGTALRLPCNISVAELVPTPPSLRSHLLHVKTTRARRTVTRVSLAARSSSPACIAFASTVDELGLGTIRHAFADMLFPGTSAPQTRARYFLFVSWTYLKIEADRVPGRSGRTLGAIYVADACDPKRLKRCALCDVWASGRWSSQAIDGRSPGPLGPHLQVDDVHAELRPDHKVDVIRQLASSGRTVAMVGDGVNHARSHGSSL
jgi:hypothetical protein